MIDALLTRENSMKNYLYILSIMLFSSTLAACSNDTIAISNTVQDKQMIQTEAKIQAINTEGKEKKDTLLLKEKSHYQFEAKDGEFVYTVFLFAEDEMSKPAGKEQLYKGHYSVYLAEEDSTIAYKQDVLQHMGAFTFQFSAEQVYSLNLGNKTLIAILQSIEEGQSTPLLLTVNDGEVKIIQSEDVLPTIFGTEIKAINQKYLQTAHFNNEGWKFATWDFDKEEMKLVKLDESIGNMRNSKDDNGDYWYSLWSEKKENYFPFLNLELNSEVIEKAKQGIPLGTPYPIGTNISNIKTADPHYMEEGFFKGTPFVMYPEITYFYNQTSGIVTAVSIPGERVKTTRDEIIRLFGNPVREEAVESKVEKKLVYLADKYVIEVFVDIEGKVTSLNLRK